MATERINGEKTNGGKLAGRTVVVTGANRGIGLAIARVIAREGAQVVITGRDESTLAQASSGLSREGLEILPHHCDVREPKSVDALFLAIDKQFGRVDILVNNAGVAHPSLKTADLSIDIWNEVIDTNLTGLFLVTRAALALMPNGSTIVNNLSMAVKTVFPGMSGYIASKYGAYGFTLALREELRSRDIRVIALIPGATATDIWNQFWPDAPRQRMISAESVANAVLTAITLPQNTTISELIITPTAGAL